MIINEGECILCENSEDFKELVEVLVEQGYRGWQDFDLEFDKGNIGVRWTPGDGPFPNCLCFLGCNVAAELREHGKILNTAYQDRDIPFVVKEYTDIINSRCVEVGDLL